MSYAEQMISPPPEAVVWCYSEWQPSYEEVMKCGEKITMFEGFPDKEVLSKSRNVRKLLILDDLMTDMSKKSGDLHSLFCRGSHHWNMSVIHIVQNLFYSNVRTARINSHYLVLMKNPADLLQMNTLARQLFPQDKKYLFDAYKDACSKPFGYLLIDMEPTTPDHVRLRTKVFPDEVGYAYLPKSL